jgi:hypothetical protein
VAHAGIYRGEGGKKARIGAGFGDLKAADLLPNQASRRGAQNRRKSALKWQVTPALRVRQAPPGAAPAGRIGRRSASHAVRPVALKPARICRVALALAAAGGRAERSCAAA